LHERFHCSRPSRRSLVGATVTNRPVAIIKLPVPHRASQTVHRMCIWSKIDSLTWLYAFSTPLSLRVSHCMVTMHPGAAERHGYRQSCTMKAQSHAGAWELITNTMGRFLSLRLPPNHPVEAANTPRHVMVVHPCHRLPYLSPGAERSSPR